MDLLKCGALRRAGTHHGATERHRRLGGEILEQRWALAADAALALPPPAFAAPFADGLGKADPLVSAAIANITTTAPADQFFTIDDPESATPWSNLDVPTASLVQSSSLISLPSFKSDPRFAGIDGAGYSVVVLDTGVDLDHPFFGPDGNGDGVADRIVYNADFISGGPNASDTHGHGTHVASIIASQDAALTGIAKGVSLICLKVLNDAGSGSAAAIEAALQWVVANVDAYNIASVNMSLGFNDNLSAPSTRPDLGLSDELAAIAAQDVIVVSASGNSYFSYGSAPGVSYPSADASSLSVGGVWDADVGGPLNWSDGSRDNTTGVDRIISFSQRHPTMTTVFAPGGAITAAAPGGGTATISGTSQAAPHVAAAAALMQQLSVQRSGSRLSLSEFADLAKFTGDLIFDGDDEDDNVNNSQQYYRRLDLLAMGAAIDAGGASDLDVAGEVEVSSSTIAAGGNVRLDFLMANKGLSDSGSFTTGVYLSLDPVIDSSDTLVGSTLDELAAGQFLNRSQYTFQIPAEVAPGDYYLGVLLDSSNVVAEANEQNNVAALPVTIVSDAPEISIVDLGSGQAILDGTTSLDFGTAAFGANDVVKTFRLYNDGTSDLLLGPLALPPGYAAVGFPDAVARLSSVDFTLALQTGVAEGNFEGTVALATNDVGEDPFSFTVRGTVDRSNSAASAALVEVGTTVDGAISPAGDRDWFKFQAVRNAQYRLATTLGTLPDTVLRLIDVGGTSQLVLNDDAEGSPASVISWRAPADGIYFLEVSAKGTQSGTFHLEISSTDDHGDDALSATATSDPSDNPGYIQTPGDVDWFSFGAITGVEYQLDVALGSLAGGAVRVVDVDGVTVIASNSAASSAEPHLSWTAPTDGVYFVVIEATGPSMTGSYDLSIVGDDDFGDNALNATAITVPSTFVGEIETPDDVDWFTIDLLQGVNYRISARGGSLSDAVVRILGADAVTELVTSDELAAWPAPTTGRFYLEVSGGGSAVGSYQLAVDAQDDYGDDAAAASSVNDPSSGAGVIETAGDRDWFALEAFGGVAYEFVATPLSLPAAAVRIIAADGTTELAALTGNPAQPAIVTWTAPADGIYFVEVAAASSGAVGHYELSIIGDDDHGDDPRNATSLIISSPVNGEIERQGDVDWFSITTLVGLHYRLDLQLFTLPGAEVRVFEADATTPVASARFDSVNTPSIQWEAAYGGKYFIEVVEDSSQATVAGQPLSSSTPLVASALDAGAASRVAGGSYRILATLQSAVTGDYDDNAVVDGVDFLVWQRSLGAAEKPSPLDSHGFEDYQPGPLDSQQGWQQLGPPKGSAEIQSDVVHSGEQAVKVDRGAGADNRWGVPLEGTWPTGDVALVTWDMRVEATGDEAGALGPFFGVEAYDDRGAFGLLGSLGVDATTLDVLYQRVDDGVLVETGREVLPGVWHNFTLLFDFTSHSYNGYVDGQLLFTTGFVDRGATHDKLDQLTDADISALAAQAGKASQRIEGTAYFDNFRIIDGLPPAGLAADGNDDGVVDALDLTVWRDNFGVSAVTPSAAALPPPPPPTPMDVELAHESFASLLSDRDSSDVAAPGPASPLPRGIAPATEGPTAAARRLSALEWRNLHLQRLAQQGPGLPPAATRSTLDRPAASWSDWRDASSADSSQPSLSGASGQSLRERQLDAALADLFGQG